MMTQEEKYTINDLSFYRLFFPREIPIHLIEQVKGRTFSAEDFYKHLEEIQAYEYQEGILQDNPSSLVFALAEPTKSIVGYIWMYRSSFDNSIFVNNFSVDKKYWGHGEAIQKAVALLSEVTKKYKCDKTLWMTTNPKYYEKFGFKRSKNVAMEYIGVGITDEIEKKFKEG